MKISVFNKAAAINVSLDFIKTAALKFFMAAAFLLLVIILGILPVFLSPSSWLMLALMIAVLISMVMAVWLFGGSFAGRNWATLGFIFITIAIIETTFRRREFTDQSVDAQTLIKLVIWCWGLLIASRRYQAVLSAALRWPVLPMFLFCLLCLVSTLWSVTPAYTFGGGVALLSLLMFAIYSTEIFNRIVLYRCILAALVVPIVLSFLLYVVAPGSAMAVMEGGNVLRLAGVLGSPNGVGRVASLSLVVLLLLFLDKGISIRNPFAWVVVVLSLVALQMSGSRTSLACVLIIVAYLIARRYFIVALVGVVFGIIVGLAFYAFPEWVHQLLMSVSRTGTASEIYTLTGRTDIWQFGWQKFLSSPVIGYGYGSTKLLYPEGYHTYWGFTVTHSHNIFLQTLITLGVTGFAIMAALIIAQVRWMIVSPDRFRDAIFIYVILSGLTEAGAMGTGPNTLTLLWFVSLAAGNVSGRNALATTSAVDK